MATPTPQPTMHAFPSIEKFKRPLAHMKRDYLTSVTTVEAVGTVKLHGVHADVVGNFRHGRLEQIQYQSCNTILDGSNQSLKWINAFLDPRREVLEELLNKAFAAIYGDLSEHQDEEIIVLAGEMVGEHTQPRSNVALQQLSDRFVIFNIGSNHGWWTASIPTQRKIKAPESLIFHIGQAPLFHVMIGLKTNEGQKELEELVKRIEVQCPFAAMFGKTGAGEGAVFKVRGFEHDPLMWFKIKGREHEASVISTLEQKTSEEIADMYASAENFAKALVTSARLKQGIELLVEQQKDTTSTDGFEVFLRWILNDVWKEDEEDVRESGFAWKLLKDEIEVLGREFFEARKQSEVDAEI